MGRDTSQSRRPRVERSKRSKLGCQTCFEKRVKCDEQKPECGRCCRLGLSCIQKQPKIPVAERRRGAGPVKHRDNGTWSPPQILPQPSISLLARCTTQEPLDQVEYVMDQEDVLDESVVLIPHTNPSPVAIQQHELNDTSVMYMPGPSHLLSGTSKFSYVLMASLLSDATCQGIPTGSNDVEAMMFHRTVYAPLKSTKQSAVSAHSLFLDHALSKHMALHFLLAVSHSELAIHYGYGLQPSQESYLHFRKGSRFFLDALNNKVNLDHIEMLLSFLYLYIFWLRRDNLDPQKLGALSTAVLFYIRSCGLDRMCDGGTSISPDHILLSRILVYMYDRDVLSSFFGRGGAFADYLTHSSGLRNALWRVSRTMFGSPSGADDTIATLFFELIALHHEINCFSREQTENTGTKRKINDTFLSLRERNRGLFHSVSYHELQPERPSLMAFVVVTFFHALRIYFSRSRESALGEMPVPPDVQSALGEVIGIAFQTVNAGEVALLDRFQWSLFIAALETHDPIHRNWLESHITDPAMKTAYNVVEEVKEHAWGCVTMETIRNALRGNHERVHEI